MALWFDLMLTEVIYVSFVLFQPPFYSRNTAEMYNNILHKPLVLKPNVSNAGRELLEGLLHKDRTKRLGGKDDFVSRLTVTECLELTLPGDIDTHTPK